MADYRDTFTAQELDGLNYRWKYKKIKLFMFSTKDYTPRKPGPSSKKSSFDNEGKEYDIDVLRMKQKFKDSCFPQDFIVDMDEEIDISKADLILKLDDMKNVESLRDYDCYFFAFFTYLAEKDNAENLLRFSGENMSLHVIWEKIRDVPQFQGKPKVFLIQSDDLSYPYPPQKDKDKTIPAKFVERRIPVDSDRLVIQSKIPQMFKCKTDIQTEHKMPLEDQSEEGSFLIQAFLRVMERNKEKPPKEKLDLLSLTTEINLEIKEMFGWISFSNKSILQYPLVSTTLTKFLYL